MADKGMSFSEIEQRLFGAVASGIPARDFIDDTIDSDFLFGKRYGGSHKDSGEHIEKLDKDLGEYIKQLKELPCKNSPDVQDAVASKIYCIDSLSALEKHK